MFQIDFEKCLLLLMFFQAIRGAQESKVSSRSISAKFSFLDVHDLVFLVPAWYPLYPGIATLLGVSWKSKPCCVNYVEQYQIIPCDC